MSDADATQILIHDAAKGDEAALRRLLILYHPRLRGRLLRQMDAEMKARFEPEDILQQVYMEAFRAIGQFRYMGKDSFLRWLFTILDRKLIDEHRALHAERRDVRRELKPAAAGGETASYADLLHRLSADGSTPSRVIRNREAVAALQACLASLPDHYRDVVQMRFIQGLPVADVASSLGRTPGSIHMICHRALTMLREQFDKLGIAPE